MRTKLGICLFFSLVLAGSPAGAQTIQTEENVRSELERMYAADQRYRGKADSVRKRYGHDSREVRLLWQRQSRLDSLNMVRLEEIIADHGWPERSVFGDKAATAAFLVVQHASLEKQKQYLPMLREATRNGEAEKESVALLVDRVRVREGRPQLYGTQLRRDPKTSQLELYPIEDSAHVEKRRAEMGMMPLEVYLEHFGITQEESNNEPE